jgi:hypothetical protein
MEVGMILRLRSVFLSSQQTNFTGGAVNKTQIARQALEDEALSAVRRGQGRQYEKRLVCVRD